MDISRAKEILELLADGIDPVTGEILPPEHTYNQGEVVRAFYTILDALQDLPKKKKRNRSKPKNAGKPWTDEDDRLLCYLFDEGSPINDLCEYFHRSKGAIAARLVRLQKIESRSVYFTRNPRNK